MTADRLIAIATDALRFPRATRFFIASLVLVANLPQDVADDWRHGIIAGLIKNVS